MQNCNAVLANFRVANGNKEVVFELLEDFKPAIERSRSFKIGFVSAADHEDLYVFFFQGLEVVSDDIVDEGVCKQDHVEIRQILLEFVVEGDGAEGEVDLFSWSNLLGGEDDVFDILLNVYKDFDIACI